MYPLYIHNSGLAHLPASQSVPTKELADIENASIIAHLLRIRGVHKLVIADEFGGDLSASKDNDNTVYYSHTVLLLWKGILASDQDNIGK